MLFRSFTLLDCDWERRGFGGLGWLRRGALFFPRDACCRGELGLVCFFGVDIHSLSFREVELGWTDPVESSSEPQDAGFGALLQLSGAVLG